MDHKDELIRDLKETSELLRYSNECCRDTCDALKESVANLKAENNALKQCLHERVVMDGLTKQAKAEQ